MHDLRGESADTIFVILVIRLTTVYLVSHRQLPLLGLLTHSVMYLVGCTINALSVETMGVTCRLLNVILIVFIAESFLFIFLIYL